LDDDIGFDVAVSEIQEANDELIREFLLSRMRKRDLQPPQEEPQSEEPGALGY
jgi:hypothetical protein